MHRQVDNDIYPPTCTCMYTVAFSIINFFHPAPGPVALDSIKFEKTSDYCIKLTWSPPVESHGTLTGYEVSFSTVTTVTVTVVTVTVAVV